MGISTLYIGFNILVLLLFLSTGVYLLLKKKGNRYRPYWTSLAVLSGQLLLLFLFLSTLLSTFQETMVNGVFLALILFGAIQTARELRNNVWAALLLGFFTTVFAAFLPLALVVGM